MPSDLTTAILALTAEKALPRDAVIDAVEEALAVTYRKQYGTVPEVRVSMDLDTGRFRVLGRKKVVIDVRDQRTDITLKDAQFLDDPGGLGDTVEVDITPSDFSRVGAQSAKQAVLQRIHEVERDLVYHEFAHKEGELLTGVIQRMEGRGVIVDLGRAEGVIPPEEQAVRERYRIGQRIKVFTLEVGKSRRMPTIVLSRSHKNLVKRLFEVEVPEIFSGIVEIRSIAREAGSRSKIAVSTRQEGIDPVGACVGLRGTRIQTVVNELNNEKIDVILYDDDPSRFVANALSPAEVTSVSVDPSNKRAEVIVPDSLLSLAIGKEGQNARLAAKLTGWRIDIKGDDSMGASSAATDLERTGRDRRIHHPVAANNELDSANIESVASSSQMAPGNPKTDDQTPIIEHRPESPIPDQQRTPTTVHGATSPAPQENMP